MPAQAQVAQDTDELEYVGFWARVGAALIDTVLLLLICMPLVTFVYGSRYWTSESFLRGPADFLINWLLPAVAVIVFWIYRGSTVASRRSHSSSRLSRFSAQRSSTSRRTA